MFIIGNMTRKGEGAEGREAGGGRRERRDAHYPAKHNKNKDFTTI